MGGGAPGVVQRFSVGFRGPLCIASGMGGVPFPRFAGGAALGALGTMPLQLGAVRVALYLGKKKIRKTSGLQPVCGNHRESVKTHCVSHV